MDGRHWRPSPLCIPPRGRALPRTPSLKNFDWWGGCAAGVPFAGKRKRTFFRNFFRVLSVLFNGALLGKGFQIFIFPEARKAPGISPGAFLVSCECPASGFSKALFSGAGPLLRTGPSPWGESGGRTLRHISRITVAPRTFLFVRGERAGRPLVFEEGWGSGRGGERPSSEGSPSPIPYPFPCPTRRIRLP